MQRQAGGADIVTIPRSLLARAFPNDPRLRAEFEAVADGLDDAQQQLDALIASATDLQTRLQALVDAGSQPHSALLDAVSQVSDSELGVFEKVGQDQVALREVDSGDDACIVSRLNLMSYVGKGATADRPALSAQRRAVYYDTTLAADGKPVFWTGTAWVDSSGAAA